MKTAYSIILILCFSAVCKEHEDWKRKSDSLAMVSRVKANVVLKKKVIRL